MLPILYQSHDLVIYSYPLLMGIAWGISYQMYFSSSDVQSTPRLSQLLFWGLFVSSWVGAKLLFYITSSESSSILTNVSFWTGGGLVFYGGLLASILYLLIFKFFDKSFGWEKFNPLLPALTIGHAIGRLGCFLAGCCYGTPTKLFWGIYSHGHMRHPTQLIESIGLFGISALLLRSKYKTNNSLLIKYFTSYSILRLVVESLRGDEIRGVWMGLTPSTWVSLGLFVIGMCLILLEKKKSSLPE